MAEPAYDPKTKTFRVADSGSYVQVYTQMNGMHLADLNFFDGVRDLDELRKLKDAVEQVIEELERRMKK